MVGNGPGGNGSGSGSGDDGSGSSPGRIPVVCDSAHPQNYTVHP